MLNQYAHTFQDFHYRWKRALRFIPSFQEPGHCVMTWGEKTTHTARQPWRYMEGVTVDREENGTLSIDSCCLRNASVPGRAPAR